MYYLICLVFPPPGKPYVRELFGNEFEGGIIDGKESNSGSGAVTPRDIESITFAPEVKA